MKTYENFISDLFVVKLPKEIIELGNVLTKFLDNNIDKGWNAGSRIHNAPTEFFKNQQRMYIYLDLHTINGTYSFINLDYDKNLNVLKLSLLSQARNKKLVDIENFLEHILSSYANDKSNIYNIRKEGFRFWISIKRIPEVIQKITQEEFDLYITTNTYNL